MGETRAQAGTGPGHRTSRPVDVRTAAGRAQRRADHPRLERRPRALPVRSRPGRNPHRTGAAWTLRTVAAILANPRYTGRQVWNRQRTDFDLADPANTTLGHRQVQRWNLPEGWVISRHPAHAALVSEADFIAAQDAGVPRGPAGPAVRRYLLAGLLACGRCGRRLESAWSNGRPAYRCRHGHASATRPEPGRPPQHLRAGGPDPSAPGRYRHPARQPFRETRPRQRRPGSADWPGRYGSPDRPGRDTAAWSRQDCLVAHDCPGISSRRLRYVDRHAGHQRGRYGRQCINVHLCLLTCLRHLRSDTTAEAVCT